MSNLDENIKKWKKEWEEIKRQAIAEAKKEPMNFEEFCKIDKSIGEQMNKVDDEHDDSMITNLKKLNEKKKKSKKNTGNQTPKP